MLLALSFGPLPAEAPSLWEKAHQHFGEIPAIKSSAPALVKLGRRLFFEPQLSLDGSQSCISCHDLQVFGADGRRFSPGVKGKRGRRNAPTVYHAAWHSSQFWDGRSPSLIDQATMPILDPLEMAMNDEAQVVARLQAIPSYRSAFAEAFPDPEIRLARVGEALAAFEEGLLTRSPFDRYLEGEQSALNDDQKRGLETFFDLGCQQCHAGPALGGQKFERPRGVDSESDLGRAEPTGRPEDRGKFKVPSLRNVSETAPYFHDGRYFQLDQALAAHAPAHISATQVSELVDFLKALRGELPQDYIQDPNPKVTPP
jgi:cytochrome c peroxidase